MSADPADVTAGDAPPAAGSVTTTGDPGAPRGWVPVERRLLGLDRATLAPAVAVIALIAFAVWGLPALDAQISRDDRALPGDVLQVSDVAAFDPAPGWTIVRGERQGEPGLAGRYAETATVTRDGVVLSLTTDTFSGTAAELLDQIDRSSSGLGGAAGYHVTGTPTPITLDSGLEGVTARFDGTTGSGLVAAFVLDGYGLEVIAAGPDATTTAAATEVAAMIQSVRAVDAEAER